MITRVQKSCLAAASVILALGLVGCSAQGGGAPADVTATDSGASEEATAEGDDGRAFDSTDDAVVTAIGAALDPDDIRWDGKVLVVTFNDGSVDDLAAGTGCLAITTIVADDEHGVIVYPDGEIDCSTR